MSGRLAGRSTASFRRSATRAGLEAIKTPQTQARRRYWRRNLRLIAGLLSIWFALSFVAVFFARDLSFAFFGWPFSFYLAAQGSLLVYLALVVFYAWAMNRLDATLEDDDLH